MSVSSFLTATGWCVASVSVGLLVAAVPVDSPELASVGGGGLAIVLISAVRAASRPTVRGEQSVVPDRLEEGESAWVSLRLTNHGRRATGWLSVVGHGPRPLDLDPIAAGASRELDRTEVLQPRRGLHRLPRPRVGVRDTFRLTRRLHMFADATTVIVHPRTTRVLVPGLDRSDADDGASPRTALDSVASFHSLREYAVGDDHRRVHWLSTARVGRPMVRQNVVPDQPPHVVVLDTTANRYLTDDTFDEAVRAAASACVSALAGGGFVELLTTSGVRVATTDPGDARTRMLDALAAANRVAGRADLAGLISDVRPGPATVLTVVTGGADGWRASGGREDGGDVSQLAGVLSGAAWAEATVVLFEPARLGRVAHAPLHRWPGLRVIRAETCAQYALLMGEA